MQMMSKSWMLSLALVSFLAWPARAGSPEPLAGFFERLDTKTAGGLARIAWYGDSAVISDGYTGGVRAALQERFGNGGPGFMLASATFDDYLRDGVRIKRQGWEASSVISGGTAGTSSLSPVPCDGSATTGRCVCSLSTGTALRSKVLRVAVSYVRMPRSHSMTL